MYVTMASADLVYLYHMNVAAMEQNSLLLAVKHSSKSLWANSIFSARVIGLHGRCDWV